MPVRQCPVLVARLVEAFLVGHQCCFANSMSWWVILKPVLARVKRMILKMIYLGKQEIITGKWNFLLPINCNKCSEDLDDY